MRVSLKLNLTVLLTITQINFVMTFENITNMDEWAQEENVTQLEFRVLSATSSKLFVFLNGQTLTPDYDYENNNILDCSDNATYITFDCDISSSSLESFIYLVDIGAIEFEENKTSIIAFRLNSDRDHTNKSLIPVKVINGNFKAPLGIKNIELDVIGYDIHDSYNYVYISQLKRYYYIGNIILVSKDFTRIQLQEDVLMSWRNLIKRQRAFVERSGTASVIDKDMEDQEVKTAYDKVTTVTTITGVTNLFEPSSNPYILTVVRK